MCILLLSYNERYAETLGTHHFPHISDINFSWFPDTITDCGGVTHGKNFTENDNDIKILFSKRDPAAKFDSVYLLLKRAYFKATTLESC